MRRGHLLRGNDISIAEELGSVVLSIAVADPRFGQVDGDLKRRAGRVPIHSDE